MKITVAIDIDGVIAHTAVEYLKIAKELGVENFKFDEYNSPYKYKTKDGRNFGKVVIGERFDEIINASKPFPEAKKAFDLFVNNPMFDVIIVTARDREHIEHTERWLAKWGFTGFRELIHTENKEDTEATVLVDDSPSNIEKFLKKGKMGIIIDRIYNQKEEFPYRSDSLSEAYQLLIQFTNKL